MLCKNRKTWSTPEKSKINSVLYVVAIRVTRMKITTYDQHRLVPSSEPWSFAQPSLPELGADAFI
jgi:hypothetical protein